MCGYERRDKYTESEYFIVKQLTLESTLTVYMYDIKIN